MNIDKLYDLIRMCEPEDEVVVDVEGMEEMVVYGVELDERDGRLVIKACRFEDLAGSMEIQGAKLDDDGGAHFPSDDDIPFEVGPPSCAISEKPINKAPEAKEA